MRKSFYPFASCYLTRRLRQGIGAIFLSNVGAEFASCGAITIGSAVLGTEVFAASGQILPLRFALTAIVRIFLDAMLILVPRTYGSGDRERADRLLGTAILATAATILVSGIMTFAGRGSYLAFCLGTETTRAAVATFYDWTYFIVVIGSLRLALERLILSEGRVKAVWSASFIFVAVQLGSLIASVKLLGAVGIVLSETLASIVSALYLVGILIFTKTTLHPRFSVKRSDIRELVKAGTPKIASRVGDALMVFAGNQFLTAAMGPAVLASAHFVKLARKFLVSIPDSLDNASSPIVCTQIGEHNWRGLKETVSRISFAAIFSGFVIAVVTYLSADGIAGLCGFHGEELRLTAFGLRCGTLFIGLYFFKDIFASYHNSLGRIGLSSIIRFLSRGYVHLPFAILFLTCFGNSLETFFIAICVSDIFLFGIAALGAAIGRQPGTTWAFNLPVDEMKRQQIFNFDFTKSNIVELAEQISAWIRKSGGNDALALRARLLTEETQSRRLNRVGARKELGECLVKLAKDRASATLLFRDTLPLKEDERGEAQPNTPDFCALVVLEAVIDSDVYTPVIGSNRTIYVVRASR